MRDRRNLLTFLAFSVTACRVAHTLAFARNSCSSTSRPALDPELVGEVVDVLTEVAHHGLTVVVVTHGIGSPARSPTA